MDIVLYMEPLAVRVLPREIVGSVPFELVLCNLISVAELYLCLDFVG